MCGRYRRTTSEEELARRYHIPTPPQRDLPISWNIAPTQKDDSPFVFAGLWEGWKDPANGEWKVPGGNIPYSISMKDDSPFVFAGLWEGWKDPANGEWLSRTAFKEPRSC